MGFVGACVYEWTASYVRTSESNNNRTLSSQLHKQPYPYNPSLVRFSDPALRDQFRSRTGPQARTYAESTKLYSLGRKRFENQTEMSLSTE